PGRTRATVDGGQVVARAGRGSRSGVRRDTRETLRAICAMAREEDRMDRGLDRVRAAAGGVQPGDLVEGQVDILAGRGMGEGLQLRRRQPESLEFSRRPFPLEVAVRDQVGIGMEYSLLLAHGSRERRGRSLRDEERDAD